MHEETNGHATAVRKCMGEKFTGMVKNPPENVKHWRWDQVDGMMDEILFGKDNFFV